MPPSFNIFISSFLRVILFEHLLLNLSQLGEVAEQDAVGVFAFLEGELGKGIGGEFIVIRG